jgi:hemolysin III
VTSSYPGCRTSIVIGRGIPPADRPSPSPLRLSGDDGSPKLRGWLHLAAFVAALPAGLLLVRRSGEQGSIVLYAVTLAALYGVSAAYHLLPMTARARYWMRRMDHAVIYVFIAGAFTPLCLLVAPGTNGKVLLAVAWIGAAVGVTIKMVSLERTRVLAGTLYIVLGWLAIAMLPAVVRGLDARELSLLFVQGALYTLGALVLVVRRPDPYPAVFGYHEVWHTMVVVATACYYVVLWSLVAHPGR